MYIVSTNYKYILLILDSIEIQQKCQKMNDTLKKWRRALNRDLRREDQNRHNKLCTQLEVINATKLGDMLNNTTTQKRSIINECYISNITLIVK